MWLAGASITVGSGPGALIRGGSFVDGSDAGPFAVSGFSLPQSSATIIGFRGAR